MSTKEISTLKLECLKTAATTNPKDVLAIAQQLYEWVTKKD